MTRVYATGFGSSYFVVSRAAMDGALEHGLTLHALEDDGTDRVIATPEDGYLEEPPTVMHIIGGGKK